MRFRILVAAAAVPCGSAAARADDFTFTLNGSAGAFSGTGTFSGSPSATAGTYNITSVSGSNTNGIVAAGGFGGNNNLLTPDAQYFVDPFGIAFYDQTADGVYQVRLFRSVSTGCGKQTSDYCVDVQEINTTDPKDPTPLPVTFPGGGGSSAVRFAVRFAVARVAPAATPAVAATPEPGSLALLGSGALALVGFGRRRFAQR